MPRRSLLPVLSLLFSAFAFIWVGCGERFTPFEPSEQPELPEHVTGAAKPTGTGKVMPGEILVKFTSPPTDVAVVSGGEISSIGVRVVKVNPGDEHAAVERFKTRSDVEYAEVNGTWEALHTGGGQFIPNDAYFNTYQWNMKILECPGAWYVTKGRKTVKIAILDTGIMLNHNDVSRNIVEARNFTRSGTLDDRNGHGTHVAGIAAAVTNNRKGVAGVIPSCRLMSGKVLGDDGVGFFSWVANGIIWATFNGADVINLSLGGPVGSLTIEFAINFAWASGVVVVAAAGNSGTDTPNYPAFYDNVIAVAATDQQDNLASFSTFGDWVDVAAPGVRILSTYIGVRPSYAFASGTSMATSHVAGLAGLLASQRRSNANIRAVIEATTDRTGSYPIANGRNGRINAHRAVDTR